MGMIQIIHMAKMVSCLKDAWGSVMWTKMGENKCKKCMEKLAEWRKRMGSWSFSNEKGRTHDIVKLAYMIIFDTDMSNNFSRSSKI